MTAEIVQIRDYQNKRDLERLKDQTLEMQACDPGPCFGAGIDGLLPEYIAPEKDPA